MMMRCIYCDQKLNKLSLLSFIKEDKLCVNCRKKLKSKLRKCKLKGLNIYYLYDYSEDFSSFLLQYKEAHDEALKDSFLYPYDDLFKLLLNKYQIVYVPSSDIKTSERGFLPMEEIFKPYVKKENCKVYLKKQLTQSNKSLRDRRLMEDNYYIKEKVSKNDYILIVDDVLTSGSSILGVYKLFKDQTRHIIVFVLAVSRAKDLSQKP